MHCTSSFAVDELGSGTTGDRSAGGGGFSMMQHSSSSFSSGEGRLQGLPLTLPPKPTFASSSSSLDRRSTTVAPGGNMTRTRLEVAVVLQSAAGAANSAFRREVNSR